MICIHGVKKERMWNLCGSRIGEVEEYRYLGVTVKAGLNGGFKSMGDRMVDANGVLGMVKYAATRSGSKYVVGRGRMEEYGGKQVDVWMWSTSMVPG